MTQRVIPPSDVTGKQRERLAREYAEEQKRKASQISMVTAGIEEEKAEVVDLTNPSTPTTAPPEDLEVEEDPVIARILAQGGEQVPGDQEVAAIQEMAPTEIETNPIHLVRCISDVQQATIGVGQHYSLEAGRKYKLPKSVAIHLEEKGYVDIIK